MNLNRIRNYSYTWNARQKRENDSDISGFVCLPSLPDWVIRQPDSVRQQAYRMAVELAMAEVSDEFVGI